MSFCFFRLTRVMGSTLSWPDDGLGEGGFMIFGRGVGAKISGGPKPFFLFFLGKFYLLKFFFLGLKGPWAPLAFYLGPSLRMNMTFFFYTKVSKVLLRKTQQKSKHKFKANPNGKHLSLPWVETHIYIYIYICVCK